MFEWLNSHVKYMLRYFNSNGKSAMLVGDVAIKMNSSIDSTNVLVANMKPLV